MANGSMTLSAAVEAYYSYEYQLAAGLFLKAYNEGEAEAASYLGECYYYGRGVEFSYEKAKAYYLAADEKGSYRGASALCSMYYSGAGTDPDYDLARSYAAKAEALGGDAALGLRAAFLSDGRMGEYNLSESVRLFHIAADAGNAAACLRLVRLYAAGKGVEQNFAKVDEYIEKLRSLRSPDYLVAVMQKYYYGWGCPVDYNKAYELSGQVISHGISTGYMCRELLYRKNVIKPSSPDEAEELLLEAARRNNNAARSRLAYTSLKKGDDFKSAYLDPVKRITAFPDANATLAPDHILEPYVKAFGYYLENAKRGFAEDAYMVGYCYLNGKGVEKNTDSAREWFHRAAKCGSVLAAKALAAGYISGSDGYEKNPTAAAEALCDAAKLGDPKAYLELALLYRDNTVCGEPRDSELALEYMLLAQQIGTSEVAYNLAKLYMKKNAPCYSLEKAYEIFSKIYTSDRSMAVAGYVELMDAEDAKQQLTKETLDAMGRAIWSRERDKYRASAYGLRSDLEYFEANGKLIKYLGDSSSFRVPDGIFYIDNGAFANCYILEEIILPEKLQSLGNTLNQLVGSGVFENCKNLKSIKIPSSVTEIGNRAFLGCTSLEEVTLGDNIDYIGENAFAGCPSLKTSRLDGVTYLGGEGEYKLAIGAADASGNLAFHPNTKYLALLDGEENSNVTSISLGNNIRAIAPSSLWTFNCDEITLPPLKCIVKGLLFDVAYRKIIISEGCEGIETSAIGSAAEQCEIFLPRSIRIIEDNAFSHGASLKIHAPDKFRMAKRMYAWCDKVKVIKYSTETEAADASPSPKVLLLPDGSAITSDGKTIAADGTVTEAPKPRKKSGSKSRTPSIFAEPTTAPPKNSNELIMVPLIDASRFAPKPSAVNKPKPAVNAAPKPEVVLPDDNKSGTESSTAPAPEKKEPAPKPKSNNAEAGASRKEQQIAKSFIIEDGVLVRYVGNGGYVEIPDKVTVIGNYAFDGRADVTGVGIHGNVREIAGNAFSNCTGLYSVIIPRTVRRIDHDAFSGCKGIHRIEVCRDTVCHKTAFKGTRLFAVKKYK